MPLFVEELTKAVLEASERESGASLSYREFPPLRTL